MIIGVNRVNIAWLDDAQIRDILNNMAANHVRAVRLTLSKPYEKSIEAVKIADDLGISVLLNVTFKQDAFPPNTKRRSGEGRTNDVFPLSRLSQRRFGDMFQNIWSDLEGRKIKVDAIELGNEINWGAFNGDLMIHAPQAYARQSVANEIQFNEGLKAYVKAISVVRPIINRSTYNKNTKIISAGLAFLSGNWADRKGIDYVDPRVVMDRLRRYGLDKYVDAYGVHFYPNIRSTAAARRAALINALAFCGTKGKSCWLTEWGLPNKVKACPVQDKRRAAVADEMRRYFEAMFLEGRLRAAFYYDWSSTPTDLFSIWRCGGLTEAGRRVVAPLP